MARPDSDDDQEPDTLSGEPSRRKNSPEIPQVLITSPSKVRLAFNAAARQVLRSIGIGGIELLQSEADTRQDEETGEQSGSIAEDGSKLNEGGEAPEDNVGEDKIQIPATRRSKRKQLEPDSADVAEEAARTKRLRGRPKVVSKQPIASGRRLRGQASTAHLEEPLASGEVPAQPVNRSRTKIQEANPLEANAISVTSKRSRSKKAPKGKEIQRDEAGSSRTIPEIHGGDAGLLDSQSPAKDPPSRTKRKSIHPKSKTRPRRHLSPHTVDDAAHVSADNGNNIPHERDIELTSGTDADEVNGEAGRQDAEGQSTGEGEVEGEGRPAKIVAKFNSDPLVDITHFDKMLITANRVGHNYKDGEETYWLKDVDNIIKTVSGGTVEKALNKLSDAYDDLQAASESGNDEEIVAAEQLVDDYVVALKDSVQSLIDTRFKSKKSTHVRGYDTPGRTKRVLMDIYFILIPQYVELVLVMARSNPLQKEMETSNLRQYMAIMKTLSTLVHAACDIPASHQPQVQDLKGSYGTKTFTIQQPAIQLKPMIRDVWNSLKRELDERKRADQLVEIEGQRLAEERRQLEIEIEEAEKHQLKIDEARKRTAEAYKRHPLHNDPVFGPLILRAEQQDKENRRVSSQPYRSIRTPSGTLRRQQRDHHYQEREVDDLAPLDEDPEDIFRTEDRLRGIFPSNNKHDGSRPWTRAESDAFMDIMRETSGEDRYSRVAEALQRSMDDIFAFAREVQAAFDEAHENGGLNERGDTWTYDVWSEPEVPKRS